MAESMTGQWQTIADADAASADPAARANAAFFGTIASEHREMFGDSGRAVAAIEGFGEIPLVVMASGRPNPAFGESADAFQEFWVAQSRELSGKSRQGRFVRVPDSSHALYLDAPEQVATEILALVARARGK